MSEWKKTTVGDVLTLQRGIDITRAEQRPGSIPVVSSGGIGSYHDTAAVQGPGVIIGRKGTLGKTFYLLGDYWPHDTTLYVKDYKGSYPRFVYYFFVNLDVMGLDVGSANPTLNRNHVHPIAVSWPGHSEQVLIADLLGALDDKIAVNARIADNCEELVVHLAADEIWTETVPLRDIVTQHKTQVAPSGLQVSTAAHYSLPAFDAARLPELVAPSTIKSNKFVVSGPSILLSKLNPSIPRIWDIEPDLGVPALASTEFLVLTPIDGISPNEIWAVCSQPGFTTDLIGMSTGTSNSHQRVNPVDLLATHVVDPRSMASSERQAINSLMARVREARLESRALEQLRDALLPKLMSGEIRVRDAEKVVEKVT